MTDAKQDEEWVELKKPKILNARRYVPLEEAVNKIYSVKTCKRGRGFRCSVVLPICFINKKIRVIIEDKNETNKAKNIQ